MLAPSAGPDRLVLMTSAAAKGTAIRSIAPSPHPLETSSSPRNTRPTEQRAARARSAVVSMRDVRHLLRPAAMFFAAVVALTACAPTRLVGDPLPSPLAPNFTLVDALTGEAVTLSALRGRVVLITFLYTTCPDICPLTAETLRSSRESLGDAVKDVDFIAVSVD